MWRHPAPDLVPEPQGNPTDVAGGEGYLPSRIDSIANAPGDSMGAKSADETEESSQGSSDTLRRIMADLDEAAREVNYGTVEELQEGERRGAPASGGRMGAYSSVGEPGGDDKKNPNAADWNGFWKLCPEGIVAVLGSMLLGMVFCCVIHLWRKRRRRMAEASAAQADTNRRTSDMKSGMPSSNSSDRWTQQPPRQGVRRPPRPPPPQRPWVSRSAQRVLQDLHSSLDKTEEPSPWPPKPAPRSRP